MLSAKTSGTWNFSGSQKHRPSRTTNNPAIRPSSPTSFDFFLVKPRHQRRPGSIMSDEIVWQIINQQFCAFKLKFVAPVPIVP
jgi:hypothetical protein